MARLNEMAVTLDLEMEVASCTEIRNVHKKRQKYLEPVFDVFCWLVWGSETHL